MARYKATMTFSWEFDGEGSLEDASYEARESASRMMINQNFDNSRLQVDIQTIKGKTKPIRVQEYDPDEIFALLTHGDEKVAFVVGEETYLVKMSSDRLHLFRNSRQCVSCGIEGKRMVLERKQGDRNFHFNFYAEDKSGNWVLMTKDHIKAKAVGGTDTMDNYVTMCQPCNQVKASYALDYEAIRKLRSILENPEHLPPKELNKKINKERLLMQSSLTGQ